MSESTARVSIVLNASKGDLSALERAKRTTQGIRDDLEAISKRGVSIPTSSVPGLTETAKAVEGLADRFKRVGLPPGASPLDIQRRLNVTQIRQAALQGRLGNLPTGSPALAGVNAQLVQLTQRQQLLRGLLTPEQVAGVSPPVGFGQAPPAGVPPGPRSPTGTGSLLLPIPGSWRGLPPRPSVQAAPAPPGMPPPSPPSILPSSSGPTQPQGPGALATFTQTALGGSLLGTALRGGLPLAGGAVVALALSKAWHGLSSAAEEYEARQRGVLLIGRTLDQNFQGIGETLSTLSERYHVLTSESVSAMHALQVTTGQVREPLERQLMRATRFARAYGVPVETAARQQGILSQLTQPGNYLQTRDPLDVLATTATQMYGGYRRPLPMSVLTEQAVDLAQTGGFGSGEMSTAQVGNRLAFLAQLGPRFQLNPAGAFAQMQSGLSQGDDVVQAIRMQALTRLSRQLPGGVLKLPGGDTLNLRSYPDLLEALERSSESGVILEAFAREAEVVGGTGAGRSLAFQRLLGTGSRRFGRLLEAGRARLGPEGLAELDREPTDPELRARVDEMHERIFRQRRPVGEGGAVAADLERTVAQAQQRDVAGVFGEAVSRNTQAVRDNTTSLVNAMSSLGEKLALVQRALFESAMRGTPWGTPPPSPAAEPQRFFEEERARRTLAPPSSAPTQPVKPVQ